MADEWAAFRVNTAASSDPWAEFRAPKAEAAPDQTSSNAVPWEGSEYEIRAAIGHLPKSMRKQALDEWSKRRVASERKEAGKAQTVYDVGRNLLRGTPVGSWLDEGVAGVKALAGGDYDEAVSLERARNEAADANATKLGTLPLIGDVTTSGLTKLAGALVTAPFAPAVRVAQGATMLPRMANALATGATYGAGYGAGEGEGAERVQNAAIGGVVGGGLGAATPLVAQGVGNAVAGIRNMRNNPLPQYDRGAVSRVARAVEDDALLPRYPHEAQNLGPAGMLADMGENLRGQAGAIANSPGRGQARIPQALEGRRDGATHRIETDLNAALGPPANVPRTVERLREEASARARPHYERFYQSPVRVSEDLHGILDRAHSVGALDRARRLMAADGYDPADVFYRGYPNSGVDNAALNARFLDYVKRAVDDLAGEAERGSNQQRIFGGIARELRNEVDRILSPNDPARSPWAIARRESGEGLQFRDAAEQGQGAFQRSRTPDQIDVDLERMNPLQQEAYRVGARDAARTAMGNAGTAWGPNGDTAARRVLQTEFGAEKLRRIAPNPTDADRLAQRLATETRFAGTEQAALGNSPTARRQAAQREFPGPVGSSEAYARTGARSLTGIALEGVHRLADLLMAGAVSERRSRIADHAARMLVAQGVGRDALVQGLEQYIRRRRLTGEQAARIREFIGNFGRGSAVAGGQAAARQPLEVTVYPSGDPRNSSP